MVPIMIISIDSDNSFAPSKRPSITTDDPVHWCIYVSPSLDELKIIPVRGQQFPGMFVAWADIHVMSWIIIIIFFILPNISRRHLLTKIVE